ncbi:helix-turn-helix domain-containing protein [Desulfofundulus sp.]|uniref:helix-turn-helix domain-containing protein n=1 Tax=Desulfofundulus sp. TaxID=2282750 RepID=UPI003C769AFF
MFCSIASEISIARQCLKISTVEFARLMKVSQASVSSWERFVRPVPRSAVANYLSLVFPNLRQDTRILMTDRYCRIMERDELLASILSLHHLSNLRLVLACASEIEFLLKKYPLFKEIPADNEINLQSDEMLTLLVRLNHNTHKVFDQCLNDMSSEELTFFAWFLNKIIQRVSIRFGNRNFTPNSLQEFCSGIFENNEHGCEIEVAKEMIIDLFHLCFKQLTISERNCAEIPHQELVTSFNAQHSLTATGVSGNDYHMGSL